jgi:phosphatidylglycerophosphatase A
MLERLQVDLDIVEGLDEKIDLQLSDKVNEAYTMLFAISTFISPLIGSGLCEYYNDKTGSGDEHSYEAVGMPITCDFVGMVNLGFALICFIFNLGIFPLAENKKFNKKLEVLREKSPLYQEEVEEMK